MKIGIVVHSYSGNTRGVAEILLQKLEDYGYEVEMKKIQAVEENPKSTGPVELKTAPDTAGFDFLFFAAPVRGFHLSPVMAAYLDQVESFQNRKAACFVTEFFPFRYMGGSQALTQMKELLSKKEASVLDTGVINWSRPNRERQIQRMTDRLALLPGTAVERP